MNKYPAIETGQGAGGMARNTVGKGNPAMPFTLPRSPLLCGCGHSASSHRYDFEGTRGYCYDFGCRCREFVIGGVA